MKLFGSIVLVIILSANIFAQKNIVPIYEANVRGLLGGVQGGKWVTADIVAKSLNGGEEYVVAGWKGVEEGGVTTGSKPENNEPCTDFYYLETELKFDSGIAIGSGAKWSIVPRVPKEMNKKDPVYIGIVSSFLKSKKIATPQVVITQLYRVDLEGDGKEEVLIAATRYSGGKFTTSAEKGDYSFIMLRKIIGGKVRNIILDGGFYPGRRQFSAPNTYQFSSVADLNGDGKMELIVNGYYYEGSSSWVYEMKGNKPTQVKELSVGCGV